MTPFLVIFGVVALYLIERGQATAAANQQAANPQTTATGSAATDSLLASAFKAITALGSKLPTVEAGSGGSGGGGNGKDGGGAVDFSDGSTGELFGSAGLTDLEQEASGFLAPSTIDDPSGGDDQLLSSVDTSDSSSYDGPYASVPDTFSSTDNSSDSYDDSSYDDSSDYGTDSSSLDGFDDYVDSPNDLYGDPGAVYDGQNADDYLGISSVNPMAV